MNFGREIAALRRQFTAAGDAARAQKARRYLKSELSFLGCDQKTVRAAAKAFTAAQGDLSRAQLGGFVRTLWQTDVHELRSVAIAILERRCDLLAAQDLDWLEDLLRSAHSWAYVDWLALHVVGDLVIRFPRLRKTLRGWAADADFWLRRAALLALVLPVRRGGGDFALFTELAVPMLADKEPFIKKAIGWYLRETGARQPELVQQFVAEHGAEMSAVTAREATRKL